MIQELTAQFLNLLQPLLATVSPPVYLAVLIGLVNSCVFYIGFGRGLARFVPYLVIGSAGAILGLAAGEQLPNTGPLLGEVSVVAVSVCAWSILFIARGMRL